MTNEQRVKQFYPDAIAVTNHFGWGIFSGQRILAFCVFKSPAQAWATAWRKLKAEDKS